jgi:hypothetical protein
VSSTAMTVRLPADLAEDLAVVADCDGEPVAEAIRAAVTAWIAQRRTDPNFQAALARRIESARRLLPPQAAEHPDEETCAEGHPAMFTDRIRCQYGHSVPGKGTGNTSA